MDALELRASLEVEGKTPGHGKTQPSRHSWLGVRSVCVSFVFSSRLFRLLMEIVYALYRLDRLIGNMKHKIFLNQVGLSIISSEDTAQYIDLKTGDWILDAFLAVFSSNTNSL